MVVQEWHYLVVVRLDLSPIDQHLKGFEAMGAKVKVGNGFIEAEAENGRLHGAKIYLDFPSVGATENIMMAAVLADGATVIDNVAKEPEIVDLANFLNKMGAKVKGAGTGTIRIEGVDQLFGADHAIIPDRIEAGTFMVAAAITGGNVLVQGAVPEHLNSLIAKMEEMGVDHYGRSRQVYVSLVAIVLKQLTLRQCHILVFQLICSHK